MLTCKNASVNISRVLQNFKLILFVAIYCVTKILTICNIFLFKFTASSLYCLWEPAENHKSDRSRSYFLESCGSEMLLRHCYTTKEASRFRNKVPKIILAETNVETFNTYIGYVISFKHML